MATSKSVSNFFFLRYNAAILVLVIAGFGINGALNTAELPAFTPLVIIHGIIMFVWYGLVVFQAWLIRKKQHTLHFTLGMASIPLAIGIIVSGFMMSVGTFYRYNNVTIFTVNLPITINFILLYGMAIYHRKTPDKHKRLMLMANIAIIVPALGRIVSIFDIDNRLTIPMWLLLLLPPLWYDRRALGRIHGSTLIGLSLVLVGIATTILLLGLPGWATFVGNLLGK